MDTKKKDLDKRAICIDTFDVKSTNFGVWVWSHSENQMSWTEGFNLLLGTEWDTEPRFELLVKCIYPDDLESFYDNLETVLDDWQPLWFTFRIMKPDQSLRTLQCLLGCIPDGDTLEFTAICAEVPNDDARKQ